MVAISDYLNDNEKHLAAYISSDEEVDVAKHFKKHPDQIAIYSKKIPEPSKPNKKFNNVVVVFGFGQPDIEKLQKLKNAITAKIKKKLVEEHLLGANENFILDFPLLKYKGKNKLLPSTVAFLTFPSTVESFQQVIDAINNTPFDKKRNFFACAFNDIAELLKFPNAAPLEAITYFPKHKTRDWLIDDRGREQYAVRCGNDTDILWFDAITRHSESVCNKQDKLGLAFCWSPLGSYFLTFHKRGVWIRSNETIEKLVCFTHKEVRHILFSPNEEFLLTSDGNYPTAKPVKNAIIAWSCHTGKRITDLPVPSHAPMGTEVTDGAVWPLYLFSANSKYLVALATDGLIVYQTDTMESVMSDSKQIPASYMLIRHIFSIKMEQFQWSPADNILSIWCPEEGNTPGRLLLVDINNKQEITSKNVFSVKSISMHWSHCGQRLAIVTVITRKLHKKLKKDVTQVEVIHVKEKSVPVDILDLEGFRVDYLHWEERIFDSRFAVLATDETTLTQKINFYAVPDRKTNQDTRLVQCLSVPASVTTVSWSPAGQYFLAASKNTDGTIIFGVLNDHDKAEIIQKDEHIDLTDIMWDPSGRYVATAVLMGQAATSYRYGGNGGYRIYSFLGRLLFRVDNPECVQFLWRPRPPIMISHEEQNNVLKNLKDYSKKFDSQDDERRQARLLLLKKENLEQMKHFEKFVQQGKDYIANHPRNKEWKEAEARLNERLQWTEKLEKWQQVLNTKRENVKKGQQS